MEEEVQATTFNAQLPIAFTPYHSTINSTSQDSYLYQPILQSSSQANPYSPIPIDVPISIPRPNVRRATQSMNNRKRPRNSQLQLPILIPDLFPFLVKNQYLVPVPSKIAPNPATKSYDPNGRCEYHMGAIGHSTEKCRQLKENVEELINRGILTLDLMEYWKSTLIKS